MEVERFRGYITALVAAILCLMAVALGAWAWAQPIDPEHPKDLAVLFGLIGSVFGAASGWLFGTETAARASHAAERSFSSGAASGAAMPEQGTTPLMPLTEATSEPMNTYGIVNTYGIAQAPDDGIDP